MPATSAWIASAVTALESFARSATKPFTLEEARIAVQHRLPPPDDLRAWGGVTTAAKRQNIIVETGHFAPVRSSNLSYKALYRAGSRA